MALTVASGQIARASQFNALVPTTVERPSDLAVINNTLANDAFLQLSGLTASATYRMEAQLLIEGSTSGDFGMRWNCNGTGSSMRWTQQGYNTGGSVDDHLAYALSDTVGVGTLSATTSKQAVQCWGYLQTGTGTNITFLLQWAQFVTDAVNGTTLFTGSRVTLTRLA